MKTLLLSFFLILISSSALATKVTAVGGDWDQGTSWSPAVVPGCFDTICIPATVTITITATVKLFDDCADTIVLEVLGRLEFQTGKKLELPCGSDVYVYSGGSLGVGGGGGSSTYIEICETEYWDASLGDITGPTVLCGSGGCVTLPIELVSFTGHMDETERRIHLEWVTKSEVNNDYFVIEKSIDGITWSFLGEVDGAGTSSIELDYYLLDDHPSIGINYYRLAQFDFDGASKTSDPISVVNGGLSFDSDLIVYQSGGAGLINVFLKNYSEETVAISLYNLSGQVVYSKELFINEDGIAIVQLDQDLSFGTYVINASEEIEKSVFK